MNKKCKNSLAKLDKTLYYKVAKTIKTHEIIFETVTEVKANGFHEGYCKCLQRFRGDC